MKSLIAFCLIIGVLQSNTKVSAQCTEAKDPEMAKYMKLTKTQDAQGCSQCGMLALYFCSAKYSVKTEDVQKVGALIAACKTNIRNMGQPYCCPDYLNKEPQWGIMAGKPGSKKSSSPGTTPQNENAKAGNTNAANNAQKLQQTEEVLNTLLKQLETNATNPLNIDTKFLNDFSGLLPEGSLKNTLQSYGSNLGTDEDLSYRQIYWDVSTAFDKNPSIASNSQFEATSRGLNLLFDNYNLISNKLKNDGNKHEFGSFINDPSIVSSLSNVTGSYETAQAAALGIDLVVGFTEALAEEKKYKEDYKKLAKLSTENLYAETDMNLNGALIDAYIGVEGYQK